MNRLCTLVLGAALIALAAPRVNAQGFGGGFGGFGGGGGGTHLLTAGTGDGSASLNVNAYGGFNSFEYNPIGPLGPQSTTVLDADVYRRIGPTGPRQQLSGVASPFTGTATSCTTTFTMGVLSFQLVQTVAPVIPPPGPAQNGMILTQVYTITNTSGATVDFDLVRYVHPHLAGIQLGGGRLAGPPEQLFLFDKNNSPNTLPMKMSSAGGTAPPTDRYEISDFPGLGSKVSSGVPLTNSVTGDLNADGLIDPGQEGHRTMALRNVFSLAAGATTTYTATTDFGSGAPPTAPTAGVSIIEPTGVTTVVEGGTTAVYDVVLNTAPTANVTVTLSPDSQVTVTPSTLTFTPANWSTPQSATVKAVDDALVEGPHFGYIAHSTTSSDTAYNGLAASSLEVTVLDNDSIMEGTHEGSSGYSTTAEGSFGFGARSKPGVLSGPYLVTAAGSKTLVDPLSCPCTWCPAPAGSAWLGTNNLSVFNTAAQRQTASDVQASQAGGAASTGVLLAVVALALAAGTLLLVKWLQS